MSRPDWKASNFGPADSALVRTAARLGQLHILRMTSARSRSSFFSGCSAGVDRANLYRALSGDAKPEFETIRKVLGALGIQLVAKPRAA